MKHDQPFRTTRRQFLRGALQASALGAVAPYFIPSGVLAANGQPGANDRIGIGFIGIGRQASDLLRNILAQKSARFVAVADVNLKRAEAAAVKNGATAYQDY